MRVDIKVVPNAKKDEYKSDGALNKVYLRAPAVDGKANKALIAFLAKHYGVPKANITITKGLKSRHKTISIEGF